MFTLYTYHINQSTKIIVLYDANYLIRQNESLNSQNHVIIPLFYGKLNKSGKKEKINMNKQFMETLKELEIKKAPEELSIEAANDNYTKKQLAHFIERHDLDIAKSWKKPEIVEALTEWMESAQKEKLESDSDLHSYYSEELVKTDDSVNIYDDNLSIDKLENILKLVEHGLAYNVDGQLWVPSEAAPVETDSANQAEEPKKEVSEKQATSSSQPKTTSQSASPSVFKEEDIEKKKDARLKYLKKQAKRKKKGKKRK